MSEMRQVIMSVAAVMLSLTAFALSLDGNDWRLSYKRQQEPDGWWAIPASVPGDAFIDLENAGVIADPMVGTNVYGLYWLEQCEWRYEKTFPRIGLREGERAELRFDGVDTRAEYWLNGERLGASANMFVPVSFDITDRMRETNALVVNIKAPLRDPNDPLGVLGRNRVGGTDVEGIRKAQHMFGWDIMPRLVSSGIWKGVSVEAVPVCRIADAHWMVVEADPKTKTARLKVDCRIVAPWRYLHASNLRLTLSRHGKEVARNEHVVRFFQTRDGLTVKDADLWWPRDAGEPALYVAVAEFIDKDGALLAKDVRRIGLRTVGLEFAWWKSEAEPGVFRFIVNGEPIYMHGCNVTPMDALHSRDRNHLAKCLRMLTDLNCNMVRIWGGGVYESDEFYDYCDENGILVWQDFMMGNVYPEQNDAFAKAIGDEARYEVIRLRSHPCLALWCGNNEQDRTIGSEWGIHAPDPDKERISREVLPRVLRDFDPITPYLPSSPLWNASVVPNCERLPQDHLWGSRHLYFKGDYWCRSSATFVSEIGCHGCPSYSSLVRMMSPLGLYPWLDANDKLHFVDDWRCKSTNAYPGQGGDGRNGLMVHQVRTLFGSVPDELNSFSEQSQVYQALALKYWIELFRSRKGRTWGLLWWNLRDGWPIVSDGVVDYWFKAKKAYAAIRSVQASQLVTLVENVRLVAVNDRLYPVSGTVKVWDAESGSLLFDSPVTVPANGTAFLTDRLVLGKQGAVRIVYVFEDKVRENVCLYGEPPFDAAKVHKWLEPL